MEKFKISRNSLHKLSRFNCEVVSLEAAILFTVKANQTIINLRYITKEDTNMTKRGLKILLANEGILKKQLVPAEKIKDYSPEQLFEAEDGSGNYLIEQEDLDQTDIITILLARMSSDIKVIKIILIVSVLLYLR
jgi:hypothetical protein